MKKGFTLVELSIVLVIIGLLIGGILLGQSLIENAKINKAINQISQYDIAVINFEQRFKCLPADCNKGIIFDGDGDGIIEDNGNDNNAFRNEIANFWYVMSTMKFINDGKIYSNSEAPGEVVGIKIPAIEIGDDTGVLVTNGTNLGIGPIRTNVFRLSSLSTSSVGLESTNFIKSIRATEAYSIDRKMDDGKARSGKVRDQALSNECVVSWNTGIYDLDNSTEFPCALHIHFSITN